MVKSRLRRANDESTTKNLPLVTPTLTTPPPPPFFASPGSAKVPKSYLNKKKKKKKDPNKRRRKKKKKKRKFPALDHLHRFVYLLVYPITYRPIRVD